MPRHSDTTPNSHTPRKRLKQQSLFDFIGSGSPSQSSAAPARTNSRKARRNQAKVFDEHREMSADGDEDSQSSDAGAIHFEPQPADIDEDVEVSPRRPAAKKRRTQVQTLMGSDEDIAVSGSDRDPEEAIGVPVTWKGRKAKGKHKAGVILDDSEEEDVQPRKRKLVRGVRPPSPDEDDNNLLDEVDENKIIEPRFRSRDKKSTFQKNLERLKRKKRGESLSSKSSESEKETSNPFAHARPHVTKESSEDNDAEEPGDEDTFIVEDENADVPELPPEFSMNTYQDLIHHFKIICQLFVHLAVNEVEEREDSMQQLMKNQYFAVPVQITRRKLTSMRDSLVTSSVWRTDFKKSLETYPVFETIVLDFVLPGCDACHLGSRMSTRLGRLSGAPYDQFSFETFEKRQSDPSSSEDDEKKPLKKEFHLGRFCAARTRVFHKFSHWEYHLFTELSREVDELRYARGGDDSRDFVRVAYAGGIQPPDDLSDADGIMDWLDERGIINLEWQKIKEMMESARNLEMRAKKGEDNID